MSVFAERVGWLEWTDAAFERAGVEQKPVLLFLRAPWCYWSEQMEQTSFADPTVIDLSNEQFVAVKVDVDRRPDIAERYALGGWPTLAFMTPAGDVMAGGTYVTAERLRDVMPQIARAFVAERARLTAVPGPPAASAAEPASHIPATDPVEWMAASLIELHDREHGGFGASPKLPYPGAVRLAMDLAGERRDTSLDRVAVCALEAIGTGELFDDIEGGFFRYCRGRDWTSPSTEKLLESNAALLLLYLHAWQAQPGEVLERIIRHTLTYVHTTLADAADGGFYASQRADPSYYALDQAGRRLAVRPPVDRTMFADANAAMIRAYLATGRVFDDSAPIEFAVNSLERILAGVYRRGGGVAHWVAEDAVEGLLNDQVQISAALVEAYEVTDRRVYLDLAHELMLAATRSLWDARRCAFQDRRRSDGPLLRQPLWPLRTNCEAAQVLAALARLTGDGELRTRAGTILSTFAAEYPRHGVDAAAYVLALRDVAQQRP